MRSMSSASQGALEDVNGWPAVRPPQQPGPTDAKGTERRHAQLCAHSHHQRDHERNRHNRRATTAVVVSLLLLLPTTRTERSCGTRRVKTTGYG
jgi:hypothetical protein